MATFAVTGATGFIGHALTEALLTRGHNIRALTRHPTPDFSDLVTPILGTLEDRPSLENLVQGADGAIHLAGSTAALNRNAYFKTNAAGTAHLLAALEKKAKLTPLVHVSSLAAREPSLSDYSASKRAGETLVQSSTVPWVIIRPPAVYGPGDAALAPLWSLVRKGVIPMIGPPQARFSLIYVDDLAQAIVRVAELLVHGETDEPSLQHQLIEIDDQFIGALGRGYGWDDIAITAEIVFGKRPKRIAVPRHVLSSLALFSQGIGAFRQMPVVFNLGKARELSHPNWVANTPANWTHMGWSSCRQLRDTLTHL